MLGKRRNACQWRDVTEPASPLHIRDFRLFWLARFLAVFSTLSMVVLIGYQTYDIARSEYGMGKSEAAFQLGLLGLAVVLLACRWIGDHS